MNFKAMWKLIKAAFEAIWESDDKFQGQFATPPFKTTIPFLDPITTVEILGILKKTKRNMSPGSNDIERADLLWCGPKGDKLANLFSAILYCVCFETPGGI